MPLLPINQFPPSLLYFLCVSFPLPYTTFASPSFSPILRLCPLPSSLYYVCDMGNVSSLPVDFPLQCLLDNLKTLSLTPDIKSKKLIKYSTQAWPTYPLDNQNRWPPFGSLDPSILRDL
ncbi:hypothetical protein H1C71_029592 [Ictidomys tridecemlineatus]|nr:hypothetical protein H1C71_029592 [Ictidomys tridecemlineatus]